MRGLGRLQSKIVEVLGRHGVASIRDLQVLMEPEHPVGYSAVANTTRLLHQRGLLTRTQAGRSFVYALDPSTPAPIYRPLPLASASARPSRRIATAPAYLTNPELEAAILAALGELGQATLDQLQRRLTSRYHATYPDMLAAVRSLVSRRLVTKQSGIGRNLYQASEVAAATSLPRA